MNIAVIGGGFTGLTACYELLKQGHSVTLFERSTSLGGLAGGFRAKKWDWFLEYSYHHLFTNDHAILRLIQEIGHSDSIMSKRPITANYVSESLLSSSGSTRGSAFSNEDSRLRGNDIPNIYQLDSPYHLFTFPGLSFIDKLRTGALIALMKVNPFWQPLEHITAEQLFCSLGGRAGWQTIWKPLMTGKFGHFDRTIAASWLWARIKKRTPTLLYINGGFHTVIDALEKQIKHMGGKIYTGATIKTIEHELGNHHSSFTIHHSTFDRILLTVPTPVAKKLLPSIQTPPVPHLNAQTLILETDMSIVDRTYWLSITDRSFPFLAVVAHTNMIDRRHYGGHHITYVGNYLPDGHKYLTMTKEQLLKEFMPFIKRLTHDSPFTIHNSYLFTAPNAQPVHQLLYSQKAPRLKTNVPNVLLANLDSIYPWDRGTNYAVELGTRAAHIMSSPLS